MATEPQTTDETGRESLLAKLLLAVASPLVFLALAEGVIAVAGVDTDLARNQNAQIAVPVWLLADDVWVADRRAKWRREGDAPIEAEEVEWLYHFEEARWIGYKMKPNVAVDAVNPFNQVEARRGLTFRLESNGEGFRDRPFPPRDPGTIRIVTLGDSSTFGWGVDPEHTYQRLLEDRLNALGSRRFEVLNLGIPGHNTRHGLGVLRHYAMELDPDILIVAFGANDPREVPVPTDLVLQADEGWMAGARFAMLRLGTYRLLRRALFSLRDPLRPGTPEIHPTKAVPPEQFVENLREFHRTGLENDAQTIFMAVCVGDRRYAAAARNVADELDRPVLDVGALFTDKIDALEAGELYPEQVDFYRQRYADIWHERRAYAVTSDGCHPHWVGHSLIADALEPMVQRTLGIPVLPR